MTILHSRRSLARRLGVAIATIQSLAFAALAFAQTSTGGGTSGGGDVTTSSTTTSTTTMWYGQWWIWAVGVAVFLVVIVALTNRGGRSSA